ncbi:hypothetical protein GQ55_5G273900 [Panicum hallii var. hallii]|uniref:Uncharacterized protein n=1 Tax=Panicum hallii var. hallii TaxID=1504633 RepID=A0A2T7DKQ2_9POAL|nr:hypothetical protein GQ55_5G273900 [Panicum hallii var. hallii]
MARAHPATLASSERAPPVAAFSSSSSSPALLLHAAWIAAAVAVCVALCTIHARKPSSSSSRRRGSRSLSSRRGSSRESGVGGVAGAGAAGGATPAKVSPTPSDTAAKASGAAGVETRAAAAAETAADVDGPVTVIDVGTHGPIAPAFLPPPDPLPPRRSLSLSAKHIRFAERLGRIRSMRRGGSGEEAAPAAAEDDVFVGCRRGGGGEVGEEGTLWTKTIILGERCRVPSAGDEDGGVDDAAVPWKSYRPRQPRSVPVTRSNSFAGVGSAGARRLGDPRF